MQKKPFVSILLVVYNQEDYIKESLISLINQDYENFEIVITDDCSVDSTVKIINEFLFDYSGNVTFNFNKKNIGIAKNVEKGLSLCKGDYIFLAAGDDISLPNRITICLEYFEKNNTATALFSNLIKIDSKSNRTGLYFNSPPIYCRNISEFAVGASVWSIGASLCFKKELYTSFSSFLEGTFQEDGILAFRALLKGTMGYIDEPLVYYRIHDANASQNLTVAKKLLYKQREIIFFDNMSKDIKESLGNDSYLLALISRRKMLACLILAVLRFPFMSFLIFKMSSMLRYIGYRK